MIINNTNNFIFIHVPKTGGTSITSLLSSINKVNDIEIGGTQIGELIQTHCVNKYGISKHTTSAVLRKSLGENLWSRYKKVSVVRDPLKRAYSAYNFLKRWEGTPQRVREIVERYDFNDFILSDAIIENNYPDNIFFPQAYWLCDKDNKILIDLIGKTENLPDLIHSLDLNLAIANLPHLINSNKNIDDYLKNLENEAISKIKSIYRLDYELFGY